MTRISKHTFTFILIFLSIFTLVLHLIVSLLPPRKLMMWFHIDDAYYYFQVARNVGQGLGFTFDGIGKSNGFHPLWMLVNIPVFTFARLNPYLPFRILIMVSALITLGGAWLLYALLRVALHPAAALLGFSVWVFFWPTHNILTQTGMEAGLNALSILLFLWLICKLEARRFSSAFLWLGFAAVGVLFARLDNIFLIFLFGLWLIFHQHPMRNLIVLDVLATFISAFISIIVRVSLKDSLGFLPAAEIFFLVAVLAKLPTLYFLELYQHPRSFSYQGLVWRITAAVGTSSLLVFLLMLGLLQLGAIQNFPRSAVFIEAGLSWALIVFIRSGFRLAFPSKPHTDLSFKTNARAWLRNGLLYLLPILVFLGGYLLWNLWTFGTPLPISGQIKQWWGMHLTVYGRQHKNLWTIFGLLPNTREDPQPWFLIQAYLFQPIYNLLHIDKLTQTLPFLGVKISLMVIYGGLLAWIFSRGAQEIKRVLYQLSFLPLLITALFLPLYYAFTGYLAMRTWYWVPQIIVTLVLFLLLINAVLIWAEKQTNPLRHMRLLPFALMVLLIVAFSLKLTHRFNRANAYDTLKYTHYLERNTPKGSLIGITGGGTEAYFIQDRTIINLDGLINSKNYFDYLRAGEGEVYLDQIGLDYVLGRSAVLLESDPYAWIFVGNLEKIDSFEGYELFSYLGP
jgi:hypothetical protein